MLGLMKPIFVGLPTYDGTRYNGAAVAHASNRCKMVMEAKHSLLCRGFNELWCAALNARPDVGWFLMLHADVVPTTPGWLELMCNLAALHQADVLSVVLPIKDDRGLTSTALDTDRWRPKRMAQAEVPIAATFTDPKLLVNTGLMLVDIRKPWADKLWFETRDLVHRPRGRYVAEVEPEDWRFSRKARKLGATLWATTEVQALHLGTKGWGL